jgi:hypothetical protein
LVEFSQSQANTKIVCSQHTKHGTAEQFHFSLWVHWAILQCLEGSVWLIFTASE